MPQAVRIPVVEDHDGDPAAPALFSHWSHDQFKCYSCHWSVFPMSREGFTHADMDEGKYCGACHNGTTAWSADDDDVECETCHVEKGYGFSAASAEPDVQAPSGAPQAEAPQSEAPQAEAPQSEAPQAEAADDAEASSETPPAEDDVQAPSGAPPADTTDASSSEGDQP